MGVGVGKPVGVGESVGVGGVLGGVGVGSSVGEGVGTSEGDGVGTSVGEGVTEGDAEGSPMTCGPSADALAGRNVRVAPVASRAATNSAAALRLALETLSFNGGLLRMRKGRNPRGKSRPPSVSGQLHAP